MAIFKPALIPSIFIGTGLLFLVASALDSRRSPNVLPEGSDAETSKGYRPGVAGALHSRKDSEQISEHRQLIFYKLSDRLLVRENVNRTDVWVGRIESNLPGLGWVCGEYVTAGMMSDPYFQHPYYYSFGTWKPDLNPDDLILEPGPFRTLNIETHEIRFNIPQEEFFALGLRYEASNRLDMNQIRSHAPVIRVASEACTYRGVANYILIMLGVVGVLLQGIFFWVRKRSQ